MSDFTTKDGRLIHAVGHKAIFKGKRNASKGKVLVYLFLLQGQYFTARQLADSTGVCYSYLCSRLSFWWSWKYLDRIVKVGDSRKPCYAYRLDERGINFVKLRMPEASYMRFLQEIKDWKGLNYLA